MAISITLPCIFLLCLFGIFAYSAQAEINNGFSLKLTHHDSSHFATSSLHYVNALHHSHKRARYFFSRASSCIDEAQSDVSPVQDGGGYRMNMSIGSPPYEISGLLDTGSDLIWTQCIACKKCFKQFAPLFDPRYSKTYKNVTCNSPKCQIVLGSGCSRSGRSCNYTAGYGDGSFSTGNVATDIVTMHSTLGKRVVFHDIIFGCAHRSKGLFSKETSGIIGLGGGDYSLISQMGPAANGKFSYCLPPLFSRSKISSKINFGDIALVSGKGVVSTPIVPNDFKTFYFLTLKGMSVGNQRIDLFANCTVSQGNVIIDSGTTFTLLPKDFYKKIEKALAKEIKHKRSDDPKYSHNLCYKVDGKFDAPVITAHFTYADVHLLPVNTFFPYANGVHCFTFAPTSIPNLGGKIIGIIGNVAQTNFLIGYDLQHRTLSFKPTDCTNY